MIERKRVLKVENREEKAEELAQCDDQSNDQGGTLSGQSEDTTDTHVPGKREAAG